MASVRGYGMCSLLAGTLMLLTGNGSALPPDLPQARANNPVARAVSAGDVIWFTGLGIAEGKTRRDLRADGWIYHDDESGWRPIPELPPFEGLTGRLGSHAVALDGDIHVIGGYTVADDHAERSTPGIYRLDMAPQPGWTRVAIMPVPVDDAVALVHGDRYLYLVSGWSDFGNVNLVQVWDSSDGIWRQAEPWPGAPVFGHAGGLVGNRLVICNGARIEYPAEGARRFPESDECWLGTMRDDNRYRLDWKPLPPSPGGPRYRAAAAGLRVDGVARVVFAGGADRPYNYDGQGYDGVPATALDSVVSYNLDAEVWQCHKPLEAPSMDHRGLVVTGDRLVIVGGMNAAREPSARIVEFGLSPPIPCGPAE